MQNTALCVDIQGESYIKFRIYVFVFTFTLISGCRSGRWKVSRNHNEVRGSLPLTHTHSPSWLCLGLFQQRSHMVLLTLTAYLHSNCDYTYVFLVSHF